MTAWTWGRQRLVAFLSSTLLFGISLPAYAQTDNSVEAESLFQEARKLLDSGDYAAACDKLAASQRLSPAVGTLLNLARCEEKIGHTATAWATYREAATAAKQSHQAEREKAARKGAAALEPVLAHLMIKVTPEASAASPTVQRDEAPVPAELWGETVPVDPGSHLVKVTATGKKTWTSTVTVDARATETVEVPALEDAPPPATHAATAPEAQATASTPTTLGGSDESAPRSTGSSWNTQKTMSVVALAIGVGGGVMALVEGLTFSSKSNELNAACPPGGCNDTNSFAHANSLRSDASTARTLAIVGGAVGGAGLVGGALLWFTAGSGPTSGTVAFAPVVFAGTVGMSCNGNF